MANIEVQRAAVENDRVGIAGGGGTKRTDLHFRVLADVDLRRVGQPQHGLPVGLRDREGIVGQIEPAENRLEVARRARLIADDAFDARQLLVARVGRGTDAYE